MKIERFTGINNRQPIDRLKPDEAGGVPLRDAINVDLSASGTPQRRGGYKQIAAMPGCRDIFEAPNFALFASASKLYKFDGGSPIEVADLPSEHSRVACVDSPSGVIWSDGFSLNLLDGDSRRLSPKQPSPIPSVSGIAGGSLVGGTYGVRFTSVVDGRQSAATNPVFVDVPDNGAIQVAASTGLNVFVTACDGSVFYREALTTGLSITIPILASSGQPMSGDIVGELPAGRMLAIHRGRLLSVSGPILYYSLPYSFGIYRPAFDYVPLSENITLVKPVEGGVYLATAKETFFLAGDDISKASLNRIAPYGAIRGTVANQPNSINPVWHSPRGPVFADQSGGLTIPQDRDIAYSSAESGASIVRETNGLRQLVTTLSSSLPSGGAVFGSFMDAKVIGGS